MEIQSIPTSKLSPNTGQIEGLPKNPRLIKDERFEQLKASIERSPEFLNIRELLVYPFGEKFVVVGGNQRLKAAKELKLKVLPCKVLDIDTSSEKLREIAIMGNNSFGENDNEVLLADWDLKELSDWGTLPTWDSEDNTLNSEAKEEKELFDTENIKIGWTPDCLFASNNEFDIPTLNIRMQATVLDVPFKGWGTEKRQSCSAATWHFYVDDYRFQTLWDKPNQLIESGCLNIIEPNLSLFDTTPISYGIHLIYKKRWIARYLQDFGIKIFADLNVSTKFAEYNQMGIPQGYNAFCTRGYEGRESYLEKELEIAKKISGLDNPNLVVYGGGKSIKNFCAQNNLIHIVDLMTSKPNK